MRIAIKTCSMDLPFEEMLDLCVEKGVTALEIATGNWSPAPHLDWRKMLSSAAYRTKWMDALRRRGLRICALNCAGNPLAHARDQIITEKTFRLAELLGVEKVVMVSGLPAGCSGDTTPVWITTAWPPENRQILEYQWNEVAIPAWRRFVHLAQECGVRRIALENHAMQLVYNPETLLYLRQAVGPMVGMNLDPSHLFWMGGDPMAAAALLGREGALYHVHAKDVRRQSEQTAVNGFLDAKPSGQWRQRSWNYAAVGRGHNVRWWRKFISAVRAAGYDEDIVLEVEDVTLPLREGHLRALKTLRAAMEG